ncbi:MAG: hypothetical protein GY777_06940 [Candidatus Brocadiaceae bacterium]|nr:hypothetical protein [Candidatus Brocadiaceae bacterium]
MLKRRIIFTRPVLIFFTILTWIFIGNPCVPGFLPKIQDVQAITAGTLSTNSCNCNQLTISSHNISGSNTLIVVGVSLDDGDSSKTVNTVTYNGISLTQLVEIQGEWNGSKNAAEIWYLNPSSNPADGSYDVVVTIDSGNTNEITAGVITFTDVDQATPIDTGTVQSNGGKAKDDTLTVTSATDDLVMNIATTATPSLTADTGQTELWNLELGGGGVTGHYGGASTKPGAAASSFTPPPPPHPPFQGSIIQKPRNAR